MNKNYILAAIIVLVVILISFGAYAMTKDSSSQQQSNITANNTTSNVTNATNNTVANNVTNATPSNNTTHKVYNPQSDSYVTVIGEKYDDEVKRWYTYDKDGVRYYNTRI